MDIGAMRRDGSEEVVALVATQFSERGPAVSPDGRWLAYSSNQSGQFEVYVAPFPDPTVAAITLVSAGGGHEPVWAPGGQELYYRSDDDELVAVSFEADGVFSMTGREVLFQFEHYPHGPGHPAYAASPDGSFYVLQGAPATTEAQIMLVQNVLEEVRSGGGGS